MALDVEVKLTDAAGNPAVGGGTWQLTVRNNGASITGGHTGTVAYTGATLTATLPVGAWTHLNVAVTPARYASASVQLNPSATGIYRDDTLAVIRQLLPTSAKIDLPLLRVREAVGVAPPGAPKVGSPLAGPWLDVPKGKTNPVYRELLVTPWLAKHPRVASLLDSGSAGPLADPDKPGWDRDGGHHSDNVDRDQSALRLRAVHLCSGPNRYGTEPG